MHSPMCQYIIVSSLLTVAATRPRACSIICRKSSTKDFDNSGDTILLSESNGFIFLIYNLFSSFNLQNYTFQMKWFFFEKGMLNVGVFGHVIMTFQFYLLFVLQYLLHQNHIMVFEIFLQKRFETLFSASFL